LAILFGETEILQSLDAMSTKRKPGRPKGTRIRHSDRYVPLSVRIPQYLLDRLEKVSQKKHQSRSESVLKAIDDYLFKNQKFWSTR